MVMLIAVLVLALPFLGLFALFAWVDRRQRLRHDVQARQIALVDRIHERLGAVAAPVLRRRRDGWQVRIDVPFHRPGLASMLLDVVLESLASDDGHQRMVEIIMTRQPERATNGAGAGGFRWESQPCT